MGILDPTHSCVSSYCTPGSELSGRVHRQSLATADGDRPAGKTNWHGILVLSFLSTKKSPKTRRLVDLGISEPRQGYWRAGPQNKKLGQQKLLCLRATSQMEED